VPIVPRPGWIVESVECLLWGGRETEYGLGNKHANTVYIRAYCSVPVYYTKFTGQKTIEKSVQWCIYKGAAWCDASFPLARQHKYLWFSAFPNFRKVGKYAATIERPKCKSVLASRELRPLTPWLGAPHPAGGCAPDPRYRLALGALSMLPCAQPDFRTWLRHWYTHSH